MSLWQRIKGGLSGPPPEQPSPLQVLTAHIDAFVERVASLSPSGKRSLSVVQPEGQRVIAIEAGLSRIEISGDVSGLRVRLLPDSFFPGVVGRPSDKADELERAGLLRDESGCFAVSVDVPMGDASRDLAQRIERVLHEILEHPADRFYSVAIESVRTPENTELITNIEKLVKAQDFDSRRLVYQSFINGLFFVPLELPSDTRLPAGVRAWQKGGLVDKGEEWAVFSDEDALGRAGRSLSEVAVVSGIRIVRCAEAHGVAALKINPKSRIGGEFLRNEVWMICDYLRKLGVS